MRKAKRPKIKFCFPDCNGCIYLSTIKYAICSLPPKTNCTYHNRLKKIKKEVKHGRTKRKNA